MESGALPAWEALARHPFRDLVTGAPAEGGFRIYRTAATLHLRLEAGADPRPATRLGLLLDPVGDGESFFEITGTLAGECTGTVFRQAPSGFKRDRRWRCEGMEWSGSAASLTLAIPFAGLGSVPPHPGWRGNFFEATPGRAVRAWAPGGWNTLYQPQRFGFIAFEAEGIFSKSGE